MLWVSVRVGEVLLVLAPTQQDYGAWWATAAHSFSARQLAFSASFSSAVPSGHSCPQLLGAVQEQCVATAKCTKLLTHLSAQVLISTLECFIRAGDTKVLFCLLPQGCLQLWDVHLITTALDAAKFSPGQMAPFTFCRSSAQWDISSFMKRIMESWASQASCSVAATHSSRIFRLFSLAWRRVANSCSSADQFSSSVHLACCCRDCSWCARVLREGKRRKEDEDERKDKQEKKIGVYYDAGDSPLCFFW